MWLRRGRRPGYQRIFVLSVRCGTGFTGNIYIADTHELPCPDGKYEWDHHDLGGDWLSEYSGDGGAANNATFIYPFGINVDSSGNVLVSDARSPRTYYSNYPSGSNVIRLLTPPDAAPLLTVQSAHTGNFMQGQTGATYSVMVSNVLSAGTTSGTVTVTETLPTGLTLLSMAGSGWTCPSSGVTCTRLDALSGGSSYPPITVRP